MLHFEEMHLFSHEQSILLLPQNASTIYRAILMRVTPFKAIDLNRFRRVSLAIGLHTDGENSAKGFELCLNTVLYTSVK